MRRNIILMLAMVVVLALPACGSRSAAQPTGQSTAQPATAVPATATAIPPTPSPVPTLQSASPTPALTATTPVTLFPHVTFSGNVVCRMGPDNNYYKVVTFSKGQSAEVQGRSEDSGWLIVLNQTPNKSPSCWVPVSSVENFGNVSDLLVNVVIPLPVGPVRATTTKGVCGNNSSRNSITVTWYPETNGAGYYIYRNGKNIASVFGNSYLELDTPNSPTAYVYTYTIQAYSSVGVSKQTASVSVTLCD